MSGNQHWQPVCPDMSVGVSWFDRSDEGDTFSLLYPSPLTESVASYKILYDEIRQTTMRVMRTVSSNIANFLNRYEGVEISAASTDAVLSSKYLASIDRGQRGRGKFPGAFAFHVLRFTG